MVYKILLKFKNLNSQYCVDAYLFSFFFAIFHRQALIIRIILSRNGICSFEHLILRWKKRWFVEKRSVWFCKEQDHIKTLNSGRHFAPVKHFFYLIRGHFNNHVDRLLQFFDPLPPHLVHVDIECPLIQSLSSNLF